MAYQDGMKPPKEKKLRAPGMETDLSRIQQLSQEHDDENWEFRSWLKQNAPDNIDGIVKAYRATTLTNTKNRFIAISP
jgi:hypothetical protein